MANMEYRRQQQGQGIPNDPFWLLFCVITVVALALAGLPWIILGFVAQRSLAERIHWRLSLLLWLVALFVGGALVYHNYQHGLDLLFNREIIDYTHAIMRYQWDILAYPFGHLLPETFPVWFSTWPGIGIAGFAAELVANRNDTVRALRKRVKQRERRAQRIQQRARKRTSIPASIPDAVGEDMVIGATINDDNEENSTWGI
jgi:hypothetical protein